MKKSQVLLLHAIFWLLFAILPQLSHIVGREDHNIDYYIFSGTVILLDLGTFYLFYFLVLPYFFYVKRRTSFILLSLLFLFVVVSSRYYVHLIIADNFEHLRWLKKFSAGRILVSITLDTLMFSTYAIFIKFTIDWFRNKQLKAELLTQNQASELALLRTQINPHFLFNTLNNIYSLVYKKSDEAPNAVMKLSEIMRYMLYESNTEKVLLTKEIEYIQCFIELQLLRLKNKDFVKFEISGEVERQLIAPMLLIPFVENAFKHGNKRSISPGITIELIANADKLTFRVINVVGNEIITSKDYTGGVGLSNVRRRLELIYPHKHKLINEMRGDTFFVELLLR